MQKNDKVEPTRASSGARTGARAVVEWCGSSFGSICLHAFALALLFLAFRSSGEDGSGGSSRTTDEVGIVFRESLSATPSEPLSETERSSEESALTSDFSSESSTLDSSREMVESFLPSNEIGVSSVGASSLHSALSSSDSRSSGVSGGQRVGFGGVKGSGRRFVYVLDHSESMNWGGGAPMRRAVSEAIASIKSLDPKQGGSKFQVVVFNHDAEVFEDGKSLLDVNPRSQERASRFLRSLIATGGTSPEKALEIACRLKPDVIFFLTDADEELSERSLEHIRALRRQFNVSQICVIEFGRASSARNETYKRLAGENGGAYAFKDVESM